MGAVNRRAFLAGVSSLAITACARAGINNPGSGSGVAAHGSMLVGLSSWTYFNGFNPVLNWRKTAQAMTLARNAGGNLTGQAIWDAGGYLNTSTGELVNPVPADVVAINFIFFSPPSNALQVTAGADFNGETWKLEWDGSATVSFPSGTSSVTGTTTPISFTTNGGNAQVTFTITNVNDPPRNIRIYQTRYATNVANGEKFNPDYVAQIKKFGTVRSMDIQATNNLTITDFAQLADEAYTNWGTSFVSATTNDQYGPKGSLHPSLICQLANLTGCKVHVCIPIKATDAFVTAFATFMKANTSLEVTYELSNEVWNPSFTQFSYAVTQAATLFSGNGSQWHGWQASRFMKIIRDIYNDTTRWRGAVGSQAANSGITTSELAGVAYYLANTLVPNNSLVASDLFKSIYIAGYFGDVIATSNITAITKQNPGVVTSQAHGFLNGKVVRMAIIGTGMTQLDNVNATVTVVDVDHYSIGIDTTGFTTFVPFIPGVNTNNAFACISTIFDLMTQSIALNGSTPGTYPTKYTYFNQQLALSIQTGTCTFIGAGGSALTTSNCIATGSNNQTSVQFPPHFTAAAAVAGGALKVSMYEGGMGFQGGNNLQANGGQAPGVQAQFNDFMFNSGYSSEIAALYTSEYALWRSLGGERPAKYTDAGGDGASTFPGIRYWPTVANSNTTDTANPVWQATVAAN